MTLLGLGLGSLLGLAAAVLAAAVLRGFTGFGFALAAVPLASLASPPEVVVPLVLVMQAAIGLNDGLAARRRADWPVVRRMVLAAAIGTPWGLAALLVLPLAAVRLSLGGLVLLAVMQTWRPRGPARTPPWFAPHLAGWVAGVCNGLAAMSGPPVVLYFMRYEPQPLVMRASLLVFFPLVALLALPMAATVGLLSGRSFILAGLLMPLMLVGGWAGAWLFRRFGGASYRHVAAISLLVTALASIVKGVLALMP